MGIGVVVLDVLRHLSNACPDKPVRVAALGYPDILATRQQLAAIFGAEIVDAAPRRADSAEILRWHGLEGQIDQVVETIAFFKAAGIEMETFDLVASRQCETILDLNQPLPEAQRGRFDVVLDGGTLEHCFNIGQAVVNALGMAKVGGHVIHVNPFSMVNHGFFNLCPTFYHDFYSQNGHALAGPIALVAGTTLAPKVTGLHPTARLKQVPPECSVMAVAQKKHDRPPAWPTQSKYLASPDLKG